MAKPFRGVINVDVTQSVPDWEPYTQPIAPEGTPSVLYIVLDDVGYSAMGPYGGLIETPNIDRIAQRGLTYTNFHTTALCSPTRSCLMTGRNHTTNGMATITEAASGFPSSNGHIPFECATIAEVLGERGWNTYMTGKWHLTAEDEMNLASRKAQWPVGRGFERFYGFLGAETNQWYPDLVYDNHPVDQPRSPEEGYHLTEDLTDKALEFIRDAKAVAPDKPFFLYYCPGACHAPHHAPKEWIDKYRGTFDMGYEAYRDLVFERQKRTGVVTGQAELSPVNPYIDDTSSDGKGWPEADTLRPWDSLTGDEKRLFARMAEVYAGFLSHADHHIGRLLDYLEDSGQLDNTIIVLVSDNGASGEGGPNELWWAQAGQYGALPLENRGAVEILTTERPQLGKPRNRYAYYPGTAEIPESVAPNIRNRSYTIAVEVTLDTEDAAGVLFAHGARFGGHALYVKDRRLKYCYNFAGEQEQIVESAEPLAAGHVVLSASFEREGDSMPGRGHPHPAHGRPRGGAGPDQDPARQVLHRRRGAQHRQGQRRAGHRRLPGPGSVGLHRRHDHARGGRRQRRAVRRPGRRGAHGLHARLSPARREHHDKPGPGAREAHGVGARGQLRDGVGGLLPRGAPGAPDRGRRLLDGRSSGDRRGVPPVREGDRVRDGRRTPADPAQYPGADPALLRPGSLVFHATAGPVDLRDVSQWWRYEPGAQWRRPQGPGSTVGRPGPASGHPRRGRGRRGVRGLGRQGTADRGGVGVRRPRRPGRGGVLLGR